MSVSREDLQLIVSEVLKKIGTGTLPMPSAAGGRGKGIFDSVDDAVAAADRAQRQLADLPVKARAAIISNMRKRTLEKVEELSKLANQETGYGRVDDKIQKNKLVIEKTPGVEDLVPEANTGDYGLTLTERAPYGVIGAITPSTNPTASVINNAISMVAAGNSVVFAPHPAAVKCSQFTMCLLNEAIVEAGGPENLLVTVANASIENAQKIMTHPGIRLLTVTGGPAVVEAASKSRKKYIAAGPGNPPAVVDETADLKKAARDIVSGASLDNNVLCIAEKEIIVVESVADELKKHLRNSGAYEASPREIAQLEKICINDKGQPNRKLVGRNASVIMQEIGVTIPAETRIILCETAPDHPFVVEELLMPVIPLVRVRDVHAAIDLAVKVENGNRHTATMHSKNIDNLHKMARMCDCSIFVKNGPSYAGLGLGGEGTTTMTIASPTGEGITTARSFTRLRRCVIVDSFRIV
ncbi:MAG: aldehyde dehydrogenase EutE [Candidatus Riflebacteria bacterium HGW-Riflebacteria-2]|jgi:propionaldehyde dehydrogenase|nr:MAG: aldehyde dehydrogenase EutE [Candidatus Riflebacteria bacterium HGW-Riflebacteria-2]